MKLLSLRLAQERSRQRMKASRCVGVLHVERRALSLAGGTGKGAAGRKGAPGFERRTNLYFGRRGFLSRDWLTNGRCAIREQLAVRMSGGREDMLRRANFNN